MNVKCVLCGETALGYAGSWQRDVGEIRLCHDDARSCYHLWTVYGMRSREQTARYVWGRSYLHEYWDLEVEGPDGGSSQEGDGAPTTGRQNAVRDE